MAVEEPASVWFALNSGASRCAGGCANGPGNKADLSTIFEASDHRESPDEETSCNEEKLKRHHHWRHSYLVKKLRKLSQRRSSSQNSDSSCSSCSSLPPSGSSSGCYCACRSLTDVTASNHHPSQPLVHKQATTTDASTAAGQCCEAGSANASGSETSIESDHSGRLNADEAMDATKKNGLEKSQHSRSASSENVSCNDRRSNSRKSSSGIGNSPNAVDIVQIQDAKPTGSPKSSRRSDPTSGQTTPNEKTRLQTAATSLKNFLAPNYKSRSEEFRKLFKTIETDKLVIDYSCAYQREILVHGRMYMSQTLLCFYANIFKWETTLTIKFKDITAITKEKTAKVIPNAIQVCTQSGEKLFFTSYSTRDKAYMMMFKLWQNALLDQPMTPVELWAWAQHGYDEADVSESELAQEAEEALASVPDEIVKQSKNAQKLRRAAASAPVIPPMFLINGDGIPGPTDELNSIDADINGGSDLDKCSQQKSSKSPRERTPPSSAGGPPTTGGEEMTESENDVEVHCPCTSHTGKEVINNVFPMSVDQMFILLFTDSQFFRRLQEYRKTTELTFGDWRSDKTTNTKCRQISYIVALNHSMGPKTCSVAEKQVCTADSRPGQLYLVKCEVQNSGVPYSDTFYVGIQYCLSRVSTNQCRIRVHAGVVYKKSCWGIVKSFIEKNALVGVQDYFSDLNMRLKAECARFGLTLSGDEREAQKVSDQQPPRSQQAEEKAASTVLTAKPNPIVFPLLPLQMERVAKAILVVLVALLLLNAGLLYKLWCLESEPDHSTLELTLLNMQRTLQKSVSNDWTSNDWLRMLQKGRSVQKKILRKWADKLEFTMKSVTDIEDNLKELRKQISDMQNEQSSWKEADIDKLWNGPIDEATAPPKEL